MSQISSFGVGGAGAGILTLTGDLGTAAGPDGAGDVEIRGGTNLNTSSDAPTNQVTVNLDGTISLTRVNALTFDTNVAAAAVTLTGVTLAADGTDANIPINITPKGTGVLATTELTLTTALAVAYGGTGLATITDHAVMLGSGVGAVTPLGVGATNNVLTAVTGADPAWAQVDLASMVTGTLPVGNGGSGAATFTDHGVLLGSAAAAFSVTAVGATGTVLKGNTGADPTYGAVDLTTDVTGILPVPNGGTGLNTITDHGIMLGSGVGAVTPLGVAGNGEIPIGSAGADPVLGTITAGTDMYVTNGAGTIELGLTADADMTAVHGWNGCLIEETTVLISEAGGVITLSVTGPGTSDLTACFSDGFYDWDCTPADTVVLTAGSDTAPQINYTYLLQSTKTLTNSTAGWPATEYVAIAETLCQSAASLGTDGPYKLHVWTDHVVSPSDQGHISMLNRWVRQQNATWVSGVAPTLTITPQGGAADNVIFTNGAGVVYQLHSHVFPAFAGTPDVYTVNDFTTPYNVVTDLNALLTDSANVSMSGRYFSLVIWGAVNEVSGESKLYVNLPGGSYANQAALLADSSKYTNFSIPTNFKGVAFLIYQMNLKHSVAASGTWTSVSNINLRGLEPSIAAGGSTAFATEFEDSVFRILDNGDNTKEIAFEASSITTATTRTITMSDFNINLGSVATNYATDGAAATPTGGTVTFTGGANIATSGAGAAVTIDLNGVIPIANGGTNANAMATTYGVNYFDGTRLVTTAVGTATHVLTSNGVGVAPTFQAAAGGGVASVTGGSNINLTGTGADPVVNLDNSPSVSGSLSAGTTVTAGTNLVSTAGNLLLPTTTAAVGQIQINANTVFHTYGDATSQNLFVGKDCGNFTLTTATAKNNVGMGRNTLDHLTIGTDNTGVGYLSLTACTEGNRNAAIGSGTLGTCTTGDRNSCNGFNGLALLTTGNYNTTVGANCLFRLVTGSNNVCIGTDDGAGTGWSGQALTGAESNNILIQTPGVIGDGNTIRIGTQGAGAGQQDQCHIAGIYGVTPAGGIDHVMVMDSTGQLGSMATLTVVRGGTGINTLTDHGVLVGSGTSAITATAVGATGTVLIGNTGADPSFASDPTVTTMYATTFDTNVAAAAVTLTGTTLAADGTDANIDITITPKGTGTIISLPVYGKGVGSTNAAVIVDDSGLFGTAVSSRRYKDNIVDMGDSSSDLMDLRPVTFNWKRDGNKKKQYGLIAEEVAEVMPQIVNYDIDGRPESVRYHDMPAIILNELQKMQSRIIALEKEIKTLKGK